jgi:hypothetical protein
MTMVTDLSVRKRSAPPVSFMKDRAGIRVAIVANEFFDARLNRIGAVWYLCGYDTGVG